MGPAADLRSCFIDSHPSSIRHLQLQQQSKKATQTRGAKMTAHQNEYILEREAAEALHVEILLGTDVMRDVGAIHFTHAAGSEDTVYVSPNHFLDSRQEHGVLTILTITRLIPIPPPTLEIPQLVNVMEGKPVVTIRSFYFRSDAD
jgi:hypothetical protein